MSLLRAIAARIKGHDDDNDYCKRSIKQIASEFSISGPELDAAGVGTAKINVGLFSRKVVELVKAKDTAVSLDETQYQLCMAIRSTKDEKLKTICWKIRLQIILSFHEFSKLIEAVQSDPSPDIRKKLVEWIDYSSDLSKHAINALNPDSTSRGVRPQHSLDEIAKYQEISEDDMQAALGSLLE
jgi:hypothetical protein